MTSIATENSSTKDAGWSLPLIVGLIAFALTIASGSRLLLDPNPYMHVALGRWMIAHGSIPRHDPFSYSLLGTGLVLHEWLAQVIMASLHDSLGWAGLVAAAALSFAAALALLCRALMRDLAPSHALIGTALAAGLAFPHFFARPHAFSLPLLVVWAALVIRARAENRAPPLYAALLMGLWANLHPGYPFGLGLAALLAGEALLDAPDWRGAVRVARGWGLFGALSLLAALATPNGIEGLLQPFKLLHIDFIMTQIQEWQSPNFQLPQPLEPWLMLVLLGALSFGIRLPVTRIAMLLILLHLALQHQRHAELLGLVAPLLVAPSLAPQLKAYASATADRWLAGFIGPIGPVAITLAGALVLALCAGAVRLGIPNDKGPFTPATAIASAQSQHIVGPVFNDINFGDYLIFVGIMPFIDGRVDMYGDTFLKRYASVAEFPELAAQYGFTWALLTPKNPHLPLLDHLTGWRRVFADDVAVVYVRD